MAQEVCSGVAYRKKAKDGDQPRSISDERLKPHTGKGLTEPLQVLRHTVSTPIPLFSSGPVPWQSLHKCGEEPSVVETSFRAGISYRTRKGGNHVSGMPSLWVTAQVSKPHLSECHRWRAVSAKGSSGL